MGTISVYAVTYFPSKDTTYDNSNSGLESTNVQGAIDELYNTCFPSTPAGNQILENTDVVTSGDGLYRMKMKIDIFIEEQTQTIM